MSDEQKLRWVVKQGDCVDLMRTLPDGYVDSIVTDPPYGLSKEPNIEEVLRHWLAGDDYVHTGGGFMGKTWDSFVPGPSVWKEAYRVLKPGGHMLVFGGTRTYDLLAIAIRIAGFEIRDRVLVLGSELGAELDWVYGQGFPKSLDVSKAIDKKTGVERNDRVVESPAGNIVFSPTQVVSNKGTPVTDDAKRWNGWGTALKPAHEPIVVARKPLIGTVVENVLEHGTGAINVDGCRVGTDGGTRQTVPATTTYDAVSYGAHLGSAPGGDESAGGRWPANVIMSHADGCRVSSSISVGHGEYSAAGGTPRGTGDGVTYMSVKPQGTQHGAEEVDDYECVQGCPVGELKAQNAPPGAHRFFYNAKTSKGERDAGLDDLVEEQSGVGALRDGGRPSLPRKNVHPTVKPIALMRWLVRLVTPPGGRVLDPFCGSGSTGIAAVLEGFNFGGFEMDEDYAQIARARIQHWQNQ